MDTITFIKEFSRMCKENEFCFKCELCNRCFLVDANSTNITAEETLAIVEKWSKEHPRKTFLSDLLEKYPNIDLKVGGGVPCFCPEILGYKQKLTCGSISCKECWNQNLEE